MKREFKKGDRVLVRNTELQEWIPAVFEEINGHYFMATINGYRSIYGQCRHIDNFRTGDKVQVRDSVNSEWKDAVYAAYEPRDSFKHVICFPTTNGVGSYRFCRWHPSVPWVDKEHPLTLEQRVEALERKLNDQ